MSGVVEDKLEFEFVADKDIMVEFRGVAGFVCQTPQNLGKHWHSANRVNIYKKIKGKLKKKYYI